MPVAARTLIQRGLSSLASSATSSSSIKKPKISWLDLSGSGLSVLERLCLEEVLLLHDNRQWLVVGHHEATRHRFVKPWDTPKYIAACQDPNPVAVIVMGIGGKPDRLLDIDRVREEGVMTIKRFSGGGTVVMDHDSIWTTVIGGRESTGDDDESQNTSTTTPTPSPAAFPREIMKWTADYLFAPMFDKLQEMSFHSTSSTTTNVPSNTDSPQLLSTLVVDNKSCCGLSHTGKTLNIPNKRIVTSSAIPAAGSATLENGFKFSLKEHDYTLGERKMGGNAQAIVKTGWLHHTSFLWKFDSAHMNYLKLPEKRPEYRQDKSHDEFLVRLSQVYPNLKKRDFYRALKGVAEEVFDLETVTMKEAMSVVDRQGGMQRWLEKHSRNRILQEF